MVSEDFHKDGLENMILYVESLHAYWPCPSDLHSREINDCILDGEMVVWDSLTRSIVRKSSHMAMKSVGLEPGDTVGA